MDARDTFHDSAQILLSSLTIVVLLFAFVGKMLTVNGDSMLPTLHDGERLVISTLGYTPSPGDIVMFTKPDVFSDPNAPDRDAPLVKRVIAVAGQTIQIDFDNGDVFVDGILQDEPYIADKIKPNRVGDWLPDAPITVPPDHVFVMGDNRNNSDDSRKSYVGMIDNRYIIGRVLLRYLPLDRFGTVS